MLGTVYFDNQFCLWSIEINNIVSNRFLTSLKQMMGITVGAGLKPAPTLRRGNITISPQNSQTFNSSSPSSPAGPGPDPLRHKAPGGALVQGQALHVAQDLGLVGRQEVVDHLAEVLGERLVPARQTRLAVGPEDQFLDVRPGDHLRVPRLQVAW